MTEDHNDPAARRREQWRQASAKRRAARKEAGLPLESGKATNTERQRRKIEHERAAGFIRKTVTIPIERDAEHKNIVAEWKRIKQEEAMNKLDTALSIAARHVPSEKKGVFDALDTPLAKLEYALKFMPHGEHYEGPFLLRPEDAEDWEVVYGAKTGLSS